MKKQLHKTLFRAVLLLLSLMCLALLVSSVAIAATSPTLKLNFIAADVQYCEVTVDGELFKTLTPDDNPTLSIPLNAEVAVTIVAQTGKQVDSLDVTTGTAVTLQNNKTISWKNFKGDYAATINCVARKYPIKLLNYDRGEILQYEAVPADRALFDALVENGGLIYQAGGTENIYLPDVEMSGYTFKGWRIITGPEADNFDLAKSTTEGGATVWYLDTALSHNYFDQEGAIYIYPVMTPIGAITYREDRIYDTTSTEYKLLASPADYEYREIDSSYSAIMQWGEEVNTGYKSYPGYEIVLNEEYRKIFGEAYPSAIVKPTDVQENFNTVVRYYKPIEYTLVYLNDDGSPLRENGTYLYGGGNSGIATNVAQPTRKGYTFVGWTVEIWRNGAWVKVMHADDQNTCVNADGDLLYPNVSRPDLTLGNKHVSYENGRTDENAIYASEKNKEGKYEIRLSANWKANSYSITYNWGLPADASNDLLAWMDSVEANVALNDYTTFTFATPLSIPSPVRLGHSFAGWTVRYAEKGTDGWNSVAGLWTPGEDGMTAIPTGSYHYDLELTATWKADRYTILLDPAGGTSGDVTQLEDVSYGSPLTISNGEVLIPGREGYTFEGFYSKPNGEGTQYINRLGVATDAPWIEESESGTVVLYAYWKLIRIDDIYTLIQTDGDITVSVESEKGLHPESTLTLISEKNLDALAEKILAAIRTPGKITVDGFMSVAEAEQILRELDVFAAYRFALTSAEPIREGELFTVTLRLSDALKGRTGLQVVYYDEDTGTVEALETSLSADGEYLIFEARRIANFAVMADPILDLTPAIIILGSILLLQIIALAILLTMRTRAKQQTTLASIAFPAIALTIRFMPMGSEWIALILAAAVVVMQVILTVLLFRSDFVYRPRRREEEETDDATPEAPAEEASATEAFAYTTAETDASTDLEHETEENALTFEETDPFAIYDTDVDAGEDFIEPAATTRYSLPEDEAAFAYADDEDADVTEEFLADANASDDAFAYADEEEAYEEETLADGEELAYADEEVYDEEVYEEDVAYDEEVYADEDAAEYDAGAYVDDTYFASEAPAEEVIYVDENGEIIEGYVEQDGDIIEDYVEETDEASEDDLYRYDE